MAPIFLILALVIQCSLIHAETEAPVIDNEKSIDIQKLDVDDETDTDFLSAQDEWLRLLASSNKMLPSTSSAAMMAQVTNSNKTLEEQLKDIKDMTQHISTAIEEEMRSFLSAVSSMANNEPEDNEDGLRKKRSIESPMDSSQMIMKLLQHIKSNNEFQNIAIEKLMTAQEIAEKYGIEFNPDPEILSDLAFAANGHAQDMTNLLRNVTDTVEFVPYTEEPKKDNDTYYVYSVHPQDTYSEMKALPSFEYMPDVVSKYPADHVHYADSYFGYPFESQISSPPVHHHSAPVTPKPSFYDPYSYPFTPASDFYSPYSVEPVMPILLVPVEEVELEPVCVGEEVEETITSRMKVEKGEEGEAVVNHVTSYTISEKSHYKPPQIEKLPQHFQYSFFLI